jgi:hypothetical protein
MGLPARDGSAAALSGVVVPLAGVDPLPLPPTPPSGPVLALRSTSAEDARGAGAAIVVGAESEACGEREAPSVISSLRLVSEQVGRIVLEPAVPLAGLVPIDLHRLEEGVDAFFERLGWLSEGWESGRFCSDIVPWLLVGAAAAWELAFLPGKVGERRAMESPCDRIALSLEER